MGSVPVPLNSLLVSSFMFSPSLSIVSVAAPFSKPMQTRGSTWFSRTPCAHEVLLYGGSEPRRGVMTDGAPQPHHIRGPDGGICVSLELATHGFQDNAHTHSGFFVRLFWFVQFCVQVWFGCRSLDGLLLSIVHPLLLYLAVRQVSTPLRARGSYDRS